MTATALPRSPGRSLTAKAMRTSGLCAQTPWRRTAAGGRTAATPASLLVVAQEAGFRVEELLTRHDATHSLYSDRSSAYRMLSIIAGRCVRRKRYEHGDGRRPGLRANCWSRTSCRPLRGRHGEQTKRAGRSSRQSAGCTPNADSRKKSTGLLTVDK